MNEKFFDLSREKQDRMINGAIKVFAMHGYSKASTDIIIREAGISKGLLFHYFGSKKNLYKFVVEYSVRYLGVELRNFVDDSEKNLFGRVILVEEAKLKMLKIYPYLDLLVMAIKGESDEEVAAMARKWQQEAEQIYYDLIQAKSDPDLIRGGLSVDEAYEIAELCMEGHKRRQYSLGIEPSKVLKNFRPYLDMLKMNFTR